MVFGQEAFLEKQELVLWAGGVVDDGNEKALEVDLDAGEQLGERCFVEVLVVMERQFP